MIKKLQLIVLTVSILFITSCSDTVKIKKFKNEVPKWYLKNKTSTFSYYGKALGEGTKLELAKRKAETLALSDALFKIKSDAIALRKNYISEKFRKNNKRPSTATIDEFEEKVELAIKNFQISDYKISEQQIFQAKNTYKVFIQIKVSKSNIFSELDSIE
jgi:uncharacterized lipoprotein YajG